jgi:hypothetical protein
MRKRILATVALGLLVCMPLAAQRNKGGGGAAMPMGRAMGPGSAMTGTPMTRTVTNPAGSITRTTTRSAAGTTRTMVNTEGNKTLTMTHSKMAGSRPVMTRTFSHARKIARLKTAHRNIHRARARHTSHSKSGM